MNEARSLIRRIYRDLKATNIVGSNLTWAHHHMGTCRMGNDPRTSVISRDLRVHDSPNLYVAGSASFVTGGAARPTLALIALSHRLAEHLTHRLEVGDLRQWGDKDKTRQTGGNLRVLMYYSYLRKIQ